MSVCKHCEKPISYLPADRWWVHFEPPFDHYCTEGDTIATPKEAS